MGKYVCEPVKYKQLYRWKCHNWMWWPPRYEQLNLEIQLLNRAGKYGEGYYIKPYLTPDFMRYDEEYARWRMLGPYPDLPTAKSVAEVFVTMRQGPRWVWKRPKKEKR